MPDTPDNVIEINPAAANAAAPPQPTGLLGDRLKVLVLEAKKIEDSYNLSKLEHELLVAAFRVKQITADTKEAILEAINKLEVL